MLRLDDSSRVKGKPTAPPQEEGAGEDPSLIRTGRYSLRMRIVCALYENPMEMQNTNVTFNVLLYCIVGYIGFYKCSDLNVLRSSNS